MRKLKIKSRSQAFMIIGITSIIVIGIIIPILNLKQDSKKLYPGSDYECQNPSYLSELEFPTMCQYITEIDRIEGVTGSPTTSSQFLNVINPIDVIALDLAGNEFMIRYYPVANSTLESESGLSNEFFGTTINFYYPDGLPRIFIITELRTTWNYKRILFKAFNDYWYSLQIIEKGADGTVAFSDREFAIQERVFELINQEILALE